MIYAFGYWLRMLISCEYEEHENIYFSLFSKKFMGNLINSLSNIDYFVFKNMELWIWRIHGKLTNMIKKVFLEFPDYNQVK